jgi:hypothetical protein
MESRHDRKWKAIEKADMLADEFDIVTIEHEDDEWVVKGKDKEDYPDPRDPVAGGLM